MARVLVTGASGFIGKQLVESLVSRGDEVACLVQPTSRIEPLEKLKVTLIQGDVTQPATLAAGVENIDAVYHLAGLTKAIGYAGYCEVNEIGVRNMLEECARRTTPPTFILVSSLAAAGSSVDEQHPRSEIDFPSPISHYGKSKRAGELVAESFAERVPITVIRPPIVLGPGDVSGLALFRSIRRFRSFVVLQKRQRFSVVHVADLVAAFLQAASHGERLPPSDCSRTTDTVSNQIDSSQPCAGQGYYFVAGSEHPTFAELARMIGRSIQRPRAWAIPLPKATAWAICACGELTGRITGRPRYLNFDRAREMTASHWICSPEKARQQLNFTPAAALSDRIQETANWYTQSGWL